MAKELADEATIAKAKLERMHAKLQDYNHCKNQLAEEQKERRECENKLKQVYASVFFHNPMLRKNVSRQSEPLSQ